MTTPTFIKLQKNIENLIDTKEDKTIFYGGILGTFDSLGNEVVDVPGRSNFSFVRLNGSLGEVIEAFNNAVQATFGLKVKVAKKPGEFFYEVVGLDLAQYGNWGDGGANPFLPKHAFTHSFGQGAGVGNDPVFIYKRQLLQPMGTQPIGTGTAFYGYVNPDFYVWNNDIRYFEGGYTANFSGLRPTNNQSRYVTIYLNGNNGQLAYKTGSIFTPPGSISGAIAQIPEVDILTEGLPLAAVYLVSGTTSVNWNNLFDIRNFLNAGGTIGAGGSVTGIIDGAVLFGSPSGTIWWDSKFKWIDSSDQLLIGTSSLPFATATKQTIVMTGTNAAIALIGYGQNGGSLFGRAVNGTQTIPSGTRVNLRLLNLEGSGYEDSEGYTTFRARLQSLSQSNWLSGSTPAYWEMWTTPTGSATAEVVHRWYGNYEDVYKSLRLADTLRFGTGTAYTQFSNATGLTSPINYKLPEEQGLANTLLQNDGSGNLAWGTVTGVAGGAGGGYPTGIPTNLVLFGRTGTIGFTGHFLFDNINVANRHILVIGATGIPSYYNANISRIALFQTGNAAQMELFSYGNPFDNGAGNYFGYAMESSSPHSSIDPTGTLIGKKLVSLGGGGSIHGGISTANKTTITAYAEETFNIAGVGTYWEINAVPTGSTTSTPITRLHAGYQETFKPFHLENLRIGTGSIYTQFTKNSSQSAVIPYILPTGQGVAGSYLENKGSGQLQWTIPPTGSAGVSSSITGIPTGAVLFGSPTGTVMWDTEFSIQKSATQQNVLLMGLNSSPFSHNSRLFIVRTGIGSIIELVSYAPSIGGAGVAGGRFIGRNISSLSTTPSGTASGAQLVSLEGAGYDGGLATGYKTRINSLTPYTWVSNADTPAYIQIEANPTGVGVPNVVMRLYGNYEEHYFPSYFDTIRFSSGLSNNYTQFKENPLNAGLIIGFNTGTVFYTGTIFDEDKTLFVSHIQGGVGTAPTIVKGPGVGTNGTAVLATGSTDVAGRIDAFVSGTSTALRAIAAVTFGKSYNKLPFVVFAPANIPAAQQGTALTRAPFVTGSVDGFSLVTNTQGLGTGHYQWNYQVM